MSYFYRWWNREPIPVPSPCVLGLNSHGIEAGPLDLIEPIGRGVRWTIYEHLWQHDEPYRVWNSARLDEAIARGFCVLIVVQGHNTSELAARFPGVYAWQPLNEIDGDGNRGRGQVYGRHIIEIRASTASTTRLVAAGIAPDSVLEFWQGMRDVYAEPDAYAVHVYGTPLGDTVRRYGSTIKDAAAGVPVWCTEFGADSSIYGEDRQREEWESFVGAADGVFARAYGYALRTDEAGTFGRVEGHGIIRPDGSPRPAYRWLLERETSRG